MSQAVSALAVGAVVLGLVVWWFWAHLVVCWELPVGRWHGRAVQATCIANGVVLFGVLACAIGSAFVR